MSSKSTHVTLRIDKDVLAMLEQYGKEQPIPVTRNAAANAVLREWAERRKKKGGAK